jgi:hypothetical protein
MNFSNIQAALSSKELRQSLIESGVEAGKNFLLERLREKETDPDLAQPLEKVDKVDLDNSVQELSQSGL